MSYLRLSMTQSVTTVFYITDPMCAWCWAFSAPWSALKASLRNHEGINTRLIMGGLAPDSDEPMDDQMKSTMRESWERIHVMSGARFNMNYWDQNVPRRSTYPACRAVLAAGIQRENGGIAMFEAIQQAHYLDAQNTADDKVLAEVATSVDLNADQLIADMQSEPVHARLTSDFMIRDQFKVTGFPSVVVTTQAHAWTLSAGYTDEATLLNRWDQLREKLPASSGFTVQ